MARGRGRRPHRPRELGPRLFRRGAWWHVDSRPWGGGRIVLRDPGAPMWPRGGERTQDRAEAARWAWRYVEYLEDEQRRERLGLLPRFPNLQEAMSAYIAHRQNVVEPATLAADHTSLRHLMDLVGEKATLDVLTPRTLQHLVDQRLREGYAPSTIRTYAISISAFANWLRLPSIRDGLTLPDPGREDVGTWEPHDLQELRNAADHLDGQEREKLSHARLALEAALATGSRESELFALSWRDFDPESRTVRIHRQLARDSLSFKPLKGKRGRTSVVFREWWPFHQGGTGLVLPGPDGGPYTFHFRRSLITRLLDTARLNAPGIGWHSCRHTYARRFIELGGRLEELQKSLGHASIQTTETAYGHLRPDVAARSAVAEIYRGEPLRILQGGRK